MNSERLPIVEVAELVVQLGTAMARPGATAGSIAELVAGTVQDDGAPLGLQVRTSQAGVDAVAVTRRWGSQEPDTAEIVLDPAISLAALERELGLARPVPQVRDGPRTVVLGGSHPGWTVFAELDDDVRALIVRRDT